MSRFRSTRAEDQDPKNDPQTEEDSPAEQEHGTGAVRVASYLATAAEPPPDNWPNRSAGGGGADFDRLGGHVGSVLRAAEEAAVRMQEEAREEGERVRGQAQKEATALAEEAREDADATRAGAERLRSETEEWTKGAHEAAEDYASDRRASAEAEAREILSAAELQAASLSKDVEQRHQTLQMDISLAEDRLRELATGLRDLAERLDDLLAAPLEGRGGDLSEAESLIDALGPSHETEEATM